jgi:glycosyltransferase involved in cell wall biosynthesis
MQNRSNLFKRPGGDNIQLSKTKHYLEKLGIKVDLSLDLEPDLSKYDVVHLFQLGLVPDENYIRCLNAKKQKKPIILSTIYWNTNDVPLRYGLDRIYYSFPNGIVQRIMSRLYNRDLQKDNIYLIFKCFRIDFNGLVKRILELCDMVLPNAEAEARKIRNDFQMSSERKFHIVPNGVDSHFWYARSDSFVSDFGIKEDFVLCVGRIEDRKNQLALIRALRGTDIKLVLVGGNVWGTRSSYYKLCRKEADENVLFVDWMEHEKISSAYAAAKVHALPSWYETPGLVNLEAGLAGCNIVATDRGSTKEYLRNYVWYCDPSNIESIKKAVLDAFAAKKNTMLSRFILRNFTWERAAEETLKAYREVLRN